MKSLIVKNALHKWMVAGKFKGDKNLNAKHHEGDKAFEQTFLAHAKETTIVLTEHAKADLVSN